MEKGQKLSNIYNAQYLETAILWVNTNAEHRPTSDRPNHLAKNHES